MVSVGRSGVDRRLWQCGICNVESAICNPQSAICKLFCGQSEQSRPSDRHMHNAVTIRTLACAVSGPFPLGLGEEWDLLT
jgi:hypothetical protein